MFNIFSAGLGCLCFLCLVHGTIGQVPQKERDALVSLYQSTDGDNWFNRYGWLNGDPCIDEWHGIYCSAGNTHVQVIFLVENELAGTLTPSLSDLTELVGLLVTFFKISF